MPTIGKDPKYSYIDLQYLPGWKPLKNREWAQKYLGTGPEGRDDMSGFEAEFSERYPEIFKNGSTSYLPPSVDYYLRHDAKGKRLDIDWELARLPLSEEEKKMMKDLRESEKRARRRAALEARVSAAEEAEEELPETIVKSLDLLSEIDPSVEA